ncbi:complement regulator-acquiring protein [Borrelia puertoricensis]|uniref:complement regulator-acquiring protein n=1 Tax=Borrelia puertoricensis TaxID=2756107 RepID=UPI001FF1061C|nr:complement regulator-acquiring protein [Borrelia puertoricensis]UPA18937.1 complement regulator-acquiring protein [Borrelia puertoricensis]
MKHKIFITSLITIFTLTTCNSDLGLFPKTGIVGLRGFLASLEPEAIKKAQNNLINELRTKAHNIKPILDLHKNDTWIEDSTQFGLKGNGKAFDKIDNKMNKQKISDNINKHIRRNFYLSLEYNERLIRDFGAVLNHIASTTTHRNNATLIMIINATITYSFNYFEIAFTLLIHKEKQLESLNFNALHFLKDEFDKLERIKQNWQKTVKNITNDYINNKNNIKTDRTKIVAHIIRNYKFNFTTAINKIKTISNNIVKILSEIK